MESLSDRGRALQSLVPPSLACAYAARADNYDAATNPSGVIDLSIAENRLSIPALLARLEKIPPPPPAWLLYDASHGSPAFLSALANFFSRRFFPPNSEAPAQSFLATSGAGAALDLLATALCDPGDIVLLPSPSYGGFSRDLCVRAGATLLAVPMGDSNRVTAAAVEAFWGTLQQSRRALVRVMLITSPHNPTGEVLRASEVQALVAWTRKRGIHAIFDEAYACSVYSQRAKFVSVARVLGGNLGNDIHIVWTFSKDFCWSGARAGVIYTQNPALLTALKPALTYLAGVSRQTQWSLTQLLEDTDWVDNFIAENKSVLHRVSSNVKCLLDQNGIPYFPSEAGLFLWIDLRRWLADASMAGEMKLWRSLVDEKVLLTPGNECFGIVPGFFRMCFAAVNEAAFEVALARLTRTALRPLAASPE